MEWKQEEKQGPKTKVGSQVTLIENLFIQRDAAVHPHHKLHSYATMKFPPLHVIVFFIEAIERFRVIFKKLALF